jgi:ParB-like chromosome segregation protein Spo0J
MTKIEIAGERSMVDFAWLNPAPYNPRKVDASQLDSICRSIVEFGIVDPFIVRQEDGLIVGGHQRYKAVERLLAGEFALKQANGKAKKVKFTLPDGKVPAICLADISDARAKLLNLALNRVTGEWDHGLLAHLLTDLHGEVGDAALAVSGFSEAEIVDYLDIADADDLGSDGDGSMPMPSAKAPNLVLDFGSKELRDAVKKHLAATTTDGKLGGDVLAEMLGVRVVPAARRARRAVASA